MLLSVLIPAYNEEYYLPACLQALRQQTLHHGAYEVIVVDNASTDRTAEVARRLGARVVGEPAKGVARARQTGCEAAQGDVLVSTDADTLVPAFWLERIAGHLGRNPDVGAVCGPVHYFDGRPAEQFIMKHPVRWALALSNQFGHSWWMGSNFAVRSEVFWRVGGFRGFQPGGLWGEDMYLAGQVGRIGQVLFDPQLAVLTSARRVQAGYLRCFWHLAQNMVRVVVLRQQSLPIPDIR